MAEEIDMELRYQEGIEDAELDLELSGLGVTKLLEKAKKRSRFARGSKKEYMKGRVDRLVREKEVESDR